MAIEVVADQKAVAGLGTETLRIDCKGRRVIKIGIYCKRDGIELISSPLHDIQTSDKKLAIATQMEDEFPFQHTIKYDELAIRVEDTSGLPDQEVTIRAQVI